MLSAITRRRSQGLLLLAAVALAGIVAALLLAGRFGRAIPGNETSRAPVASEDMALYIPPPQMIEELVSPAEVVVVGRVGPIVDEGRFLGYDDQGKLIPAPTEDPRERDHALAYVDIRFDVEQTLLDDGTVASGGPLILRAADARGGVDSPEFPMYQEGHRYLFVLSKNPDGKTYGPHHGAYSRLWIDGPVVAASDGDRTPVRFGGETVSPVEFIQRLKAALRQKEG